MNSGHVNLHKYYSCGQDMHNFRVNNMSNFLRWLKFCIYFERIRTKMKHLKDI